MYQSKSPLNRDDFHSSNPSKIDYPNGKKLHKALVVTFPIKYHKRTTTISPSENIKIE